MRGGSSDAETTLSLSQPPPRPDSPAKISSNVMAFDRRCGASNAAASGSDRARCRSISVGIGLSVPSVENEAKKPSNGSSDVVVAGKKSFTAEDLFWNRFCFNNAALSLMEDVVSSTTVDCDTSVNSLSISSSASSTPSASAPSAFSPRVQDAFFSSTTSSTTFFRPDSMRSLRARASSSTLLASASRSRALSASNSSAVFGAFAFKRAEIISATALALSAVESSCGGEGDFLRFRCSRRCLASFSSRWALAKGFSESFIVSYCLETHPVDASCAVGLSLRLLLRSLLRLRSLRERSLLERSLDRLRERSRRRRRRGD
mmetsp:Transcript_8748/g.23734  ORF Transcript_8748/g.23734 Transcript_8748/m.23734 type:complete len:318 (+) Transcript_8748:2443-3396(+)